MDTAELANGSTTNGNEGPIDRLVREIEEMLAPLEARRGQLIAELHDVEEEQARLQAGIDGLTGVLRPPSEEEKPRKKKPQSDAASGYATRASQKTIDDVYAAIATSKAEDPTAAQIMEVTGMSQTAVMAAIAALRQSERIRVSGSRRNATDSRTSGRAPSTYAVMP